MPPRSGSPPCVQEELGLHGQSLQVVRAVLLEQDRQVGVGRGLVEGVRARYGPPEDVPGRDLRVVIADGRAEFHQTSGDLVGRGSLLIGDVRLVGDAEQEHPRGTGGLPVLVEQCGGALDDVPGHVVVDLLGQFDHPQRAPRGAAEVLGDPVPADPRAGPERLEPERLGLRAADDVPQVDAQVVAEHGHLVDERDVDVPEVGLQDLHGLRLAGATRAYDLVGEPPVEGGGRLGARGVRPPMTFGVPAGVKSRLPGSTRLGE